MHPELKAQTVVAEQNKNDRSFIDPVNFYGKTDWKTNTTSSSATTGDREGYITIKINGTDKKLYYYS